MKGDEVSALEEGTHTPPQVGNALIISAVDDPVSRYMTGTEQCAGNDLPKVRHKVAPRIQHHVTYEKTSDEIMTEWHVCNC